MCRSRCPPFRLPSREVQVSESRARCSRTRAGRSPERPAPLSAVERWRREGIEPVQAAMELPPFSPVWEGLASRKAAAHPRDASGSTSGSPPPVRLPRVSPGPDQHPHRTNGLQGGAPPARGGTSCYWLYRRSGESESPYAADALGRGHASGSDASLPLGLASYGASCTLAGPGDRPRLRGRGRERPRGRPARELYSILCEDRASCARISANVMRLIYRALTPGRGRGPTSGPPAPLDLVWVMLDSSRRDRVSRRRR